MKDCKNYLTLFCIGFTWAVFLFACKQKETPPYPGFSKTSKGVFYKRITIGDGKYVSQKGDSLYVRVLFTDTLGTIIFNSANNRGVGVIALFIDEKTKNNLFEDALTTMVEGDSTQFIIKADSLYSQSFNIQLPSTVKKGENIYVFAQLYKHKRAEQIEFEKKQYERWAKEMADIERKQIEEYLEKNKLSFSLDSSGIYWLSKSPGNGKSVWQYPSVYIYLKGFLLNGVEVENTYLPNTPLEYFPGQPQQVVKAIEICLKQVRVGGKAHFIAPSALAYGAVGSSTGIIPPFTAVRYIIEVKAP